MGDDVIVFNSNNSERLDKFLCTMFPECSRSHIQRLINEGYVLLNGNTPKKTGIFLEKNDEVIIHFPEPEPLGIQPENIPLNIIYEDSNVVVVNKPAGMVVHPSAGHQSGTLVHALLGQNPFLEGIGGKHRPGIVHRLDKNTSGIIIVAKNEKSHQWLQRQFKARLVDKIYFALVDGHPKTPSGKIIAPIQRHKVHRKKLDVAPEGSGKMAETDYSIIRSYHAHTFLEVRPLTGRTHQIRVHLSSIGIPVAGDTFYGKKNPTIDLNRHFLHAGQLNIFLPGEKQKKVFKVPLPEDLSNVLSNLK